MKETQESKRCLTIYIGSRKMAAMLGDLTKEHPVIIRSEQLLFPKGFENGFVSNLQDATLSIEKILDGMISDDEWGRIPIYVVLGNGKIKLYRYESCQYFPSDKRVITASEVSSVIEQTRSIAALPLTEAVLQAIPESFLVNDMPDVRNPIGLEAERLGVTLQIHTLEFQLFRNIQKVFESLDLNVLEYIPKAIPLSEASLNDLQRQEGALILDVADSATQLVMWKNGLLSGVKTIPFGGEFLTKRIAQAWDIEPSDAEKVKEKFATLDPQEKNSEELIPLVTRNNNIRRSVSKKEFLERFFFDAGQWMRKIIEEADVFLNDEKLHFPNMLWSGGTVKTDGFLEWVQSEFSHDGKVVAPHGIEAPQEILRDPSLAAVLGTFAWMKKREQLGLNFFVKKNRVVQAISKVQSWIENYF